MPQRLPQAGRRLGRGAPQGVDQRQREFLLLQVGAERLAGRLLLACQVEQVIGHLERHPEQPAVTGQVFDHAL